MELPEEVKSFHFQLQAKREKSIDFSRMDFLIFTPHMFSAQGDLVQRVGNPSELIEFLSANTTAGGTRLRVKNSMPSPYGIGLPKNDDYKIAEVVADYRIDKIVRVGVTNPIEVFKNMYLRYKRRCKENSKFTISPGGIIMPVY